MDWAAFKEQRIKQLRQSEAKFWVYRCYDPLGCTGAHVVLDGIALQSDHPFWQRWLPPHSAQCRCGVAATHLLSGVPRIGGDPQKPLPDWWTWVDPTQGTGVV